MAEHARAEPIYFTHAPRQRAGARGTSAAGGRAVVLQPGLRGGMLAIYDAEQYIPLLWTHLIPATLEGKALHNVQTPCSPRPIAYARGVAVENIRQGLRTFDHRLLPDAGPAERLRRAPLPRDARLRPQRRPHGGAGRTVRQLRCTSRRIGVIAAPGDRRDEDIRALAPRPPRQPSTYIFLREDEDLRGRAPGEVGELLREGLLAAGFPAERICTRSTARRTPSSTPWRWPAPAIWSSSSARSSSASGS